MRSIWSSNYTTYKSSNPFTKSLNAKDPNKVVRPNTLGLTKTLTTSIYFENKSKRKFERIDNENLPPSSNSQLTSSASSAADSDYATDSNENEYETESGNKRSKIEVIKALKEDIDSFVSGYATNKVSLPSSPSPNESNQSPILNKVSEIYK
jgi:hypothetical protein